MSNRLKVNQKEIEQLNLRSEEVREIMGHIPSKLIRYGITIVFFVVFLIIISSFFFKYPDVIDANFEIVTQNPPAEIIAKSNGNLSHVFVTDSQSVKVNTLLGVVQNPANTSDILRLRSMLTNIERKLYSARLHLSLPDSLQLGELQSFYYSLLSASLEYHQFIELRYFKKKIKALDEKEKQLHHYLNNSLQQFKLKESELELTKRQFSRDSILFGQELISASNYEKSKKSFIQEKIALQSKQSTVINTHLQINELKQQIVELQLEQKKQDNQHKQNLKELFSNLDSKVAWWFDQYALISPICGNVAFNKIWSDNQFISAGTHVFSVIPNSQQAVIGRVTLESAGVGKIKPNQNVNLKLDNYPFKEFGMIRAKVKSISLLPVNGEYFIDLDLPDLLVTNYGIKIPFSQKMPGVAEIITEDLPLIVRLVNPMKNIIMSQVEDKEESRLRIKRNIPTVQNNN